MPWPLLILRPERESAVTTGEESRFGLAVGKSGGERSGEVDVAAGTDARGGGGARSLPSLCARAAEPRTCIATSAAARPPRKARWKRAFIADLPPPDRGLTSHKRAEYKKEDRTPPRANAGGASGRM